MGREREDPAQAGSADGSRAEPVLGGGWGPAEGRLQGDKSVMNGILVWYLLRLSAKCSECFQTPLNMG